MTRRMSLAAAAVAAAVFAFAGCETFDQVVEVGTGVAVATGHISDEQAASLNKAGKAVSKTFDDITPEQEYYIGRTVAATCLARYKALDDARLNDYLNRLGQTLARFSSRPETFGGYHFLLLQSEDLNAFAAPGGLILVTRGLVDCCTTEDELAAVLAHEIGHVQNRDGLRAIRTGRLNTALTTLATEGAKTLAGPELAEVTSAFDDSINEITGTLINSGYSRRQEFQADAAAVGILRAAGYSPAALRIMLRNMEKRWDPSRHDFAATHPSPSDRIAQLAKLVPETGVAPSVERARRFHAAVK
jgi:predicted Zn-dependent protease